MGMIAQEPKDYSDGRTKQSFKDQCDINKILAKAWKTGSISHLQKHGATYGDFSDVPDLLEAHRRIKRGNEVFAELPSEVRKEFGNDMFRFYEYVTDPANAGRLHELLPALAKPGRQAPAVVRSARSEADPKVASAPAEPPTDPTPAGAPASSTT